MKRRITLHVGNPKTGTSAIQSFFSANRDVLPIIYPAGRGDQRAARGFPTSGNASDIARRLKAGDDPVTVAHGMIDGALYSSEQFWDVGWRPFAQFLSALDTRIILYVRPQVSAIPSGFAQISQNNKFPGTLAEYYTKKKDQFAYSARYTQLRSICDVTIRPFIRDRLVNRNIVDDFCATVGIAIPDNAVRLGQVNTREWAHLPTEFGEEIARYYSADNCLLDQLSGVSLGLNEANMPAE